jgi:16S rRNA (guanine(966)-N(2))-methyltransferase RsmD
MGIIIMGGEFRGRKLATDSSSQIIRPTSGKVRQALFSSLGESLIGQTFVDLYAGTGAVGLEAASRGAKEVYLVEKHPKSWALLKTNAKSILTGADESDFIHLVHGDALGFCQKMREEGRKFPFIFADPPFADDFSLLHDAILGILEPTGTGIIQYPSRNPPNWVGKVGKLKKYGESGLAFLVPVEE